MDSSETFVPQLENMDLSSLKGKNFVVGISTGNRDSLGVLPSTIRGPFDYHEMLDYVFNLWSERLDHAKVLILSKNLKDKSEFLDAKTTDYIIEKAPDLLLEDIMMRDPEPFTCVAGILTEEPKGENK
jgi:hypothetical protein